MRQTTTGAVRVKVPADFEVVWLRSSSAGQVAAFYGRPVQWVRNCAYRLRSEGKRLPSMFELKKAARGALEDEVFGPPCGCGRGLCAEERSACVDCLFESAA